jgi:hypothetical protein
MTNLQNRSAFAGHPGFSFDLDFPDTKDKLSILLSECKLHFTKACAAQKLMVFLAPPMRRALRYNGFEHVY